MKPEGRQYYETINPSNGEKLSRTLQSTDADIETAVAAAKTAQVSWAALPAHVRARHLYSIARHIQKHTRLLSVIESLDNGKPFRETRDADVPIIARHFYHYAGWAQLMDTEMSEWKPVGVVAGIVAWNFPLMLMAWKVAPALAMGSLKPFVREALLMSSFFRQHGRDEASYIHPLVHASVCRDLCRGRAATRRLQRHHRNWAHRLQARRAPRRR